MIEREVHDEKKILRESSSSKQNQPPLPSPNKNTKEEAARKIAIDKPKAQRGVGLRSAG